MESAWIRPSLLNTISLRHHALIEASAGTGKTFLLENLLVELLLKTDVKIEQILVVTFTEKAARDLKNRLYTKLKVLVQSFPKGESVSPDRWQLDWDAVHKLHSALFSFEQASISTIHGFCHHLLARHAFEQGRLFQERKVDGKALFAEVFRDALCCDLAQDQQTRRWIETALEVGWDVEQLEELLYSCISERGRWQPENICVEPFLEALMAFPWEEICSSLKGNLKAAGLHANTAHAAERKIHRLASLKDEFLNERDPIRLWVHLEQTPFVDWLEQLWTTVHESPCDSDKLLAGALLRIRHAVVPLEAAFAHVLIPPLTRLMEAKKRREGLYDFDDMLLVVQRSIQGEKGRSLVNQWRARYRYALIDEFQDTDEVQWSIFHRLFIESPGENCLYLIGDPKQAIYGFRGAHLDTYLIAKEIIQQHGGIVVYLEENYRSTSVLISACNALLDQNAGAAALFQGEVRYDHPVVSGSSDKEAHQIIGPDTSPVVLLPLSPSDAQQIGEKLIGPSARLPKRRKKKQEFFEELSIQIASTLKELLTPSSAFRCLKKGISNSVKGKDVFVLTRTWNDAYRIASVFQQYGIRYIFHKAPGLFQTKQAIHVKTVLEAIADPFDFSQCMRAWLTPFFDISLEMIAHLQNLLCAHPLRARLIEWHTLAQKKDYSSLFSQMWKESGLAQRLIFRDPEGLSLTTYAHIFEVLLDHAQASPSYTLQDMVMLIDSLREASQKNEEEDSYPLRASVHEDAVQIMTIYASKGLEAKVVFLAAGIGQSTRSRSLGIFSNDQRERVVYIGRPPPDLAIRIRAEQEEQEARLLYVALTRARLRLYLPWISGQEKNIKGPYARLNQRLTDLIREEDTSLKELFSVKSQSSFLSDGDKTERLSLPDSLSFMNMKVGEKDWSSFSDLKKKRLGAWITSYTKLKGNSRKYDSPGQERVLVPLERINLSGQTLSSQLPPGPEIGLLLHFLLEKMPFSLARDALSLEDWIAHPIVDSLLERGMEQWSVDPVWKGVIQGRIWTALKCSIRLGDGCFLEGISSLDNCVRETEFLYPLPLWIDFGMDQFGFRREEVCKREGKMSCEFYGGQIYVRGMIDCCFEKNGKMYLVDWKSDRLADWGEDTLRQHVLRNYVLQAQIYTAAMVRMMLIDRLIHYQERFGGIFFGFLRGMSLEHTPTPSVLLYCPQWDDIIPWISNHRKER
ncbi:UvrD-helicase domain-containing protein [Pajaroellobacter abortibovis]|uniref:DNA 3'-5' helicase n=1 Tax=Pajaroellobacter abortibovis TaxID=1882918 RepID=A0A1L6MWZ3_9BACT|nr:UvrD-helicase domain-containing protein [Pajaroellobacter abortibovis]APR99955.1 hypothetical protein BCY86_04105 [Pajaroellobacter abortibovis]